jgi:hypothetical protein
MGAAINNHPGNIWNLWGAAANRAVNDADQVANVVANDVGQVVNGARLAVNEYNELVGKVNKYAQIGKAFAVVTAIVVIATAAAFFNPLTAALSVLSLAMCYDVWRFSDNCQNLVTNPLNLLLPRNEIYDKMHEKTIFFRFIIGRL